MLLPRPGNATTTAIAAARNDVRKDGGRVPLHLRDAHYQGAKTSGHGRDYAYPHDDPSGFIPQSYWPQGMEPRIVLRTRRSGARSDDSTALGSVAKRPKADSVDTFSCPCYHEVIKHTILSELCGECWFRANFIPGRVRRARHVRPGPAFWRGADSSQIDCRTARHLRALLGAAHGALRKAGLVGSVRGAQGGYELASPPQNITVGD